MEEATRETIVAPEETKKSKRKLFFRVFTGGIFVLMFTFGYFLWKTMNGPSQGVITYQDTEEFIPEESPEKKKFSGTYASFQYSAVFSERNREMKNVLEQTYLEASGESGTRTLSFIVFPSGDQGLSGLKLRESDPRRYKETKETITGARVSVFANDTEGFERTIFSVRSDRILALSYVTKNSSRDFADAEWKEILSSLEIFDEN